jgi:hypothetical protein
MELRMQAIESRYAASVAREEALAQAAAEEAARKEWARKAEVAAARAPPKKGETIAGPAEGTIRKAGLLLKAPTGKKDDKGKLKRHKGRTKWKSRYFALVNGEDLDGDGADEGSRRPLLPQNWHRVHYA